MIYPIKSNAISPRRMTIPVLSVAEINYLHKLIDLENDIKEGTVFDPHQAEKDLGSVARNNVGVAILDDQLKFSWLYDKLAKAIVELDRRHFNLGLTHIESLQYCMYNAESESYYAQHVDVRNIHNNLTRRKLSFSINLCVPESYEGGSLELYDGTDFKSTTDIGHGTFFESTILHEVTQVTEGTRVTLVGWAHGPNV